MDVQTVRGPMGDVIVAYEPIPIASGSYDVVATMTPSTSRTQRIQVSFQQGITVVGFHASVRPLLFGSFPVGLLPTPEDVLVQWDLYQNQLMINQESLEPGLTPASTGVGTLSSLDVQVRLIQKCLAVKGKAAPQLGFVFQNRYPTVGAGMLPAALSIRLTILAEDVVSAEGNGG